jgi:hypothetical protein
MPNKKEAKKPIENQKTAAWANIENASTIAKTAHPSLLQTLNAKEYVDSNEK